MDSITRLQMFDSRGHVITTDTWGYRQLAIGLGQYLAELWPGMATVKYHGGCAVAYDCGGIRYDSIALGSLPKDIQEAICKLDISGIELEYWHHTADWIGFN